MEAKIARVGKRACGDLPRLPHGQLLHYKLPNTAPKQQEGGHSAPPLMFTDGFKGVDTPPLMFTHGFEGVAYIIAALLLLARARRGEAERELARLGTELARLGTELVCVKCILETGSACLRRRARSGPRRSAS